MVQTNKKKYEPRQPHDTKHYRTHHSRSLITHPTGGAAGQAITPLALLAFPTAALLLLIVSRLCRGGCPARPRGILKAGGYLIPILLTLRAVQFKLPWV